MNILSNPAYLKLLIASASLLIILVILYFVYKKIFSLIRKRVLQTTGKLDDFIFNLFKIPSLWFIYWVVLKIFTHLFLKNIDAYPYLLHINKLLLISAIAWIAVQMVKAGTYYLQGKFDINTTDNLVARKNLTQIKVFKAIINSVIAVLAFSAALLTFDQARNIGLSILTSAGIIGIIVGLAAQKTIGMILAGIQIAITQPIRLDDVVIVEGEWGRIEEITLTYVVVKIWDERRLVLPVNYFLEKPFQNWTRNSANITGAIFLYVDYSFPVHSLRDVLPVMLRSNELWDGRVFNVQVTKVSETYKEIRVLLSSANASKNWDLRTAIREQLIDYINEHFPETFARIRVKSL